MHAQSTSIRSAEDRSSALLKSHQTWYTSFLVSERDRRDADRAKNKDKYDAACSSLESARQKQDSAKDPEKGERAYARALADMECAKDAYLASIQSNNRSQHMFFSRDLPAVHRHYQTLWTLIVSNLTDFLRRGCYATEAHLAKLKDVNDRVLEAVGRIDPDVDQKIYVDFNSKPFFPPADKTFEVRARLFLKSLALELMFCNDICKLSPCRLVLCSHAALLLVARHFRSGALGGSQDISSESRFH